MDNKVESSTNEAEDVEDDLTVIDLNDIDPRTPAQYNLSPEYLEYQIWKNKIKEDKSWKGVLYYRLLFIPWVSFFSRLDIFWQVSIIIFTAVGASYSASITNGDLLGGSVIGVISAYIAFIVLFIIHSLTFESGVFVDPASRIRYRKETGKCTFCHYLSLLLLLTGCVIMLAKYHMYCTSSQRPVVDSVCNPNHFFSGLDDYTH